MAELAPIAIVEIPPLKKKIKAIERSEPNNTGMMMRTRWVIFLKKINKIMIINNKAITMDMILSVLICCALETLTGIAPK